MKRCPFKVDIQSFDAKKCELIGFQNQSLKILESMRFLFLSVDYNLISLNQFKTVRP